MSKFMSPLLVSRLRTLTALLPVRAAARTTGGVVAGPALVDAGDDLEALDALLDQLRVRVVRGLLEELLVGLDSGRIILRGLGRLRELEEEKGLVVHDLGQVGEHVLLEDGVALHLGVGRLRARLGLRA